MPLMWAHAEYIKLLRSRADGGVFDLIPEVSRRYLESRAPRRPFEVWKHNRRARSIPAGGLLRIQALEPFTFHWSSDNWSTTHDSFAISTPIGIEYVDIEVPSGGTSAIVFTFRYANGDRWEGVNFTVNVT